MTRMPLSALVEESSEYGGAGVRAAPGAAPALVSSSVPCPFVLHLVLSSEFLGIGELLGAGPRGEAGIPEASLLVVPRK